MEPMNYALEGRGLMFPDNISTFSRNGNILKDWNLNPFSDDVDKNMFGTSSQEITVNTEYPDIVKKCTTINQLSRGLGDETVDVSASIITLDQVLGEVELETRFSDTDNRSNDPLLSSFGLKLEQLIDHGELRSSSSLCSKARSHSRVFQVHGHKEEEDSIALAENSDSLLLGKRLRTTNLYSQVPLCRVYGCNKDLSSSKGYHKRHRVCDEHSKTAKVIVNGVEQRFCQQCSRFHVLAEFDEGKRSCRKRLAGHNERRRKPQFDAHWGSRLLEMTSERKVPFLFPVMRHDSSFCEEKYENHNKHIILEQSPTKRLQHHHVMRKENSSKIHPGAAQSVQELSAGQNSACALSLLSAHSQRRSHNTENHCAYLKRDHNLENFGKDRIVHVLDDGQAVSSHEIINQRHVRGSNSTSTVDLAQLSAHLQRVEQLKNSVQVKEENKIFQCFT